MSSESELVALERNLQNATDKFQLAEQAESAARKDRCDAQNALNAAQRQMDDYFSKLKRSAPHDTDWGLKRNPAVRCEA